MIQFHGSAVLPTATPMTYQQLIHAAIDARTYSAVPATDAKQKTQEKAMFTAATVGEGFVGASVDGIYAIDAYKGVRNGVADPAAWAAGDFTQTPGGGEPIVTGDDKHFNHRMELGARVLYQATGGNVVIYLDFSSYN